LEDVRVQDNTVFAYATALRRLLSTESDPVIARQTTSVQQEHCIDVASFIDGEVLEIFTMDAGTAEDHQALEMALSRLDPSFITCLSSERPTPSTFCDA
jgi:hypothetical protein